MSQRFIARLTTFRSFVAGVLTLFVLTLALTPRAEAFVYWTDIFGGIGRANLDGTAVDKRFITGVGGPTHVAVDAKHVYWANPETGTVGRANLDGTRPDPSFITAVVSGGITVDAEHIYWAHHDNVLEMGMIGRANLDGTGVDQDFITSAGFFLGGVAVDAAHVYWTNSQAPAPGSTGIGRANLDGAGVDPTFIPDLGDLAGVAVDAKHVYWAGLSTIGRANLDGTGAHSFIRAVGQRGGLLVGVAVDAKHVYWANVGEPFHPAGPIPAIGRAKLDGTGTERSLVTGFRAGGVAVDALRSFSFGKVKRNKKRGTAKLTVVVPGPGELKLAKTKKVRRAKKRADAEGNVKLPVKPRGNARKKLNRKGKAKVKAEVAYSPRGGDSTIVGNTDTKTVKLIMGG